MLKFAEHTAHLLSWKPEGHEEVLYLSPQAAMEEGKAIRGGVPVCWPWFGSKKGKPSHGIARTSRWRKKTECKFELNTNEAKLVLKAVEFENTLTLSLISTNTTFKTYDITQALHTYFLIGNINNISIEGHDQEDYYDKVAGANAQQVGLINFDKETDRIYQTKKSSILIDPVMRRKLVIEKEGSASTVIWNPWVEKTKSMADLPDQDYQKFCCIEAANTHLDPLRLKATEQHELIQKITVHHL